MIDHSCLVEETKQRRDKNGKTYSTFAGRFYNL